MSRDFLEFATVSFMNRTQIYVLLVKNLNGVVNNFAALAKILDFYFDNSKMLSKILSSFPSHVKKKNVGFVSMIYGTYLQS